MIVLDTNVVSELMKTAPSESVRRWALHQPGPSLCITAITLAEILYGIERLPGGRRQEVLRSTATDVFASFADITLPFDVQAATRYSSMVIVRDQLGRPINGFDAQIASICAVHGCSLATRNTRDFEHTGIDLINPWTTD